MTLSIGIRTGPRAAPSYVHPVTPPLLPLTLATMLVWGCAQAAPEYDAGWEPGPSLPEPLQELHAATLDDRIYVAGGIAGGNTVSARVFVLGPDAGAWRRVADLPAPRHHMPLVVVADSLYAVGGYDASGMVAVKTLWVYDERADRWLDRPSLPEARGASAAGAVDGRILVVGGVGPGNRLLDSIAIYDARLATWTRGAPLPTPRVYDGKAADRWLPRHQWDPRSEKRARQDSNLRLLPPEGSALSTELRAPELSGA